MTLIDGGIEGTIDVPSIEGLDEARMKLRERISEVTQSAETEGDVTFILCEYGVGGSTNLHEIVFDFATGQGPVVEEILKVAQTDALDRGKSGGKCRYVVKAIRGDRQVPGRCLFALEVVFEGNEHGEVDELPNDRGLTAQAMRHVEICLKVGVGSAEKQIASLTKLLKDKDDAISMLMRQQMDQFKIFQDLMDAKFARDLEFQRFKNEEARKEKVAGMLEQGVPILVNKFLGGGHKLITESSTPVESMLEGFLGSFNKEQLTEIGSSGKVELDLVQRSALHEMMLTIIAKKEAQEKQTNGAATESH